METTSQTSKQWHQHLILSACAMNSETSLVFTNDDEDQPGKSGVRTGYVTHDGHISQIPGLSPTISSAPEERLRGRRVAVLESDSDYVKLAKQGGHKGLLWHVETNVFKPNAYSPPEWFCMESEDHPTTPSSHQKTSGAYLPLKAPFGTDNTSTWERDNGNSDGKEKNLDGNCNQMEEMQTSNQHGSRFKRTSFDKRPVSVDMTKLLRFGYAEDSKPKH